MTMGATGHWVFVLLLEEQQGKEDRGTRRWMKLESGDLQCKGETRLEHTLIKRRKGTKEIISFCFSPTRNWWRGKHEAKDGIPNLLYLLLFYSSFKLNHPQHAFGRKKKLFWIKQLTTPRKPKWKIGFWSKNFTLHTK